MAVTPPPEITIAEPISIPILNVLPPSSDTESWSCSPSPRPHRYHSRSRNQEKRRAKVPQEDISKNRWDKGQRKRDRSQNPSHASPSPPMVSNVEEEEQGSPSLLLLPPSRSWSRSPSPSRRSRWSIRSLLSKDSDCDSSRSVCSPSCLCSLQHFLMLRGIYFFFFIFFKCIHARCSESYSCRCRCNEKRWRNTLVSYEMFFGFKTHAY